MDSCASSESNKCKQIELLTICLYSEGSEDRFVVVQHFWCRKICQIVCRVSRKWMESKFLDQDVDVLSLANKGIAIGCFVSRNYNKILMETRKLTGNIMVTKNGLGSGVDRMFQSSDSAFCHFNDRLNPFGKSVEFDILFLEHYLAHASHASMIISKFWCHENETGSLNFRPLRIRSLSFSFCTILRSPVTIWPHGAHRNSEPGQVQGRGFWERLLKSICCRLLL